MEYQLRLHELAEAELDAIFDTLNREAGPITAGQYVGGLYDLINGLTTFPERGTVRPGPVPGLRIIGFRRSASLAFTVEAHHITILGVFWRGQNVTPEILKNRL